MPDIDIDFANRNLALDKLKHVAARLDTDKRHNTGVYVQNIPYDPIENISTIEYKTAEDRGYFKIDFLNVNVYDKVKDRAHLTKLMGAEPLWDLLLEDEFTDKLFHVNGHGSILRQMKPNNIEQLAAILAMIRPAKRHLIGKDWPAVLADVWVKPENDEYYFKKAHAIAYAHVIVVQMNLIIENLANFAD
jgi:DNA polymerase III alpha subunit